MSSGRLFQSFGPTEPNERSPTVTRRDDIAYSSTVIGTLAVDGWAVTFCTARRGLGGAAARPVLYLLYTKCNSPPINGQCTNFILFDVGTIIAFGV